MRHTNENFKPTPIYILNLINYAINKSLQSNMTIIIRNATDCYLVRPTLVCRRHTVTIKHACNKFACYFANKFIKQSKKMVPEKCTLTTAKDIVTFSAEWAHQAGGVYKSYKYNLKHNTRKTFYKSNEAKRIRCMRTVAEDCLIQTYVPFACLKSHHRAETRRTTITRLWMKKAAVN